MQSKQAESEGSQWLLYQAVSRLLSSNQSLKAAKGCCVAIKAGRQRQAAVEQAKHESSERLLYSKQSLKAAKGCCIESKAWRQPKAAVLQVELKGSKELLYIQQSRITCKASKQSLKTAKGAKRPRM